MFASEAHQGRKPPSVSTTPPRARVGQTLTSRGPGRIHLCVSRRCLGSRVFQTRHGDNFTLRYLLIGRRHTQKSEFVRNHTLIFMDKFLHSSQQFNDFVMPSSTGGCLRELESARLWDTNPRLRPPTRPGDSSPVIDGQLGRGKRWKRPENRRRFGLVTQRLSCPQRSRCVRESAVNIRARVRSYSHSHCHTSTQLPRPGLLPVFTHALTRAQAPRRKLMYIHTYLFTHRK